MGTYQNPKSRAKAFKKKEKEHAKYLSEHKDKIENKKRSNQPSKSNKNNQHIKSKTSNKSSQQTKRTTTKKPVQDNKQKTKIKKFVPSASTIIRYNSKKRKDFALFVMIPVKFKFMSNKMKNEYVEKIFKLVKDNSFIYSNISSEHKGNIHNYTDIDKLLPIIFKNWNKRKLRIKSLRKFALRPRDGEIYFYKYKHQWYFVFNMGYILWHTIDYRLMTGKVSYKFHVDGLNNANAKIAVLSNWERPEIKIKSCKDVMNLNRENDSVYFYWNDNDSYNTICKIYHKFMDKAKKDKDKYFDYEYFYEEARDKRRITEFVVKTSPKNS